MQASLQYATSSFSERKSASSLLVSAAAAVASEKVPILGSSTACVLTLDQSTGIASIANLGDSGVLIGRWQKGKAVTLPKYLPKNLQVLQILQVLQVF